MLLSYSSGEIRAVRQTEEVLRRWESKPQALTIRHGRNERGGGRRIASPAPWSARLPIAAPSAKPLDLFVDFPR